MAAHRLGDNEQAMMWAEKYVDFSFASRAVSALEAAELFVDIGADEEAVAKAYEAIAHAPKPDQKARGPWLSEVSTTPYYNSWVGRAIGVLCKAGRDAEAFSLTEDNPDIGASAVRGCRVAIEGENPRMTLEQLADSLSLRSVRQLQDIRAATLVEAGDYETATQLIKHALASPPAFEGGSIAAENLGYLRLAVAMRDESLTRDVMRSIAADASSVDGRAASEVFAAAASYTFRWPDGQISD